MHKILIRLTFIVTTIANLSLLVFVPSCDTVNSNSMVQLDVVRQIFSSATGLIQTPISQDAQVSGRPGNPRISKINGPSGLLGYSVEREVVSRSGPFRIRVLLDAQLSVKRVTVVSYPWDRGRDVRKRAFTSQFEGKGPQDPIQLGKDIDAITGATISSRVMAEGVRDTIKLLKLVREKRREKQTVILSERK